jgi:phosphatidylglycerol:prolipoprotein diacylglycerol transferase
VHPIILKAGKFVVYSYSLMVVAAFIFSVLYVYLESKRIGEDQGKAVDLGIYTFILSFVGARLLHCMIYWRTYIKDPVRIFKIWEGGLVYYGGLILCIMVVAAFIRRHNLNLAKWMDMCAPVAMITLVCGRIGCFLNGCCYGTVAPSWLAWSVKYPPGNMPLELAGAPLHPTPLYEMLAAGIILAFVIWRSRHKKFEGEITWLTLCLYSIARLLLEFLRADPRGGIAALHLSTSQLISAILFVISGYFLATNYRKPGTQGVAV